MFRPLKEEVKYLPTLFVIDEVQNHMGAIDPVTGKQKNTADPILTWWVSYHRHLYMDVLILSQQYQKIHIAYRRDVGYFLHGIESQSLLLGKFSPNLVYNKYKSSPYTEKNRAGKVKVKKRKELFDAYVSGDAVRSKSLILPYIISASIFLVLAIAVMSYLISSYSNDDGDIKEEIKTVIVNDINTTYTTIKSSVDMKGLKYLKLNCFASICKNEKFDIDLNVDDLQSLLENTNSKFLRSVKVSDNFAVVYLLVTSDFLDLFLGAKKNEKDNKGFNILG